MRAVVAEVMTAALWIGGTQVYCRLGAVLIVQHSSEKSPTVNAGEKSTPVKNAASPRSTNSG